MVIEQSCGALVYRFRQHKREFLMIKHQNGSHIGFPKGHVEDHEKPYETAFREVYEETGIKTFIIKDYTSHTSYSPTENTYKEVTYFIGRPINTRIRKQVSEVSDVFWCDEDHVRETITYEGDKAVFDQLYQTIISEESDISSALYSYIETHIIPQYNQFDEGHHSDHIYEVVKASFDLVKQYPARKDFVYLIACFHDLGLQFGRETHHITSGELLRKDVYVSAHYQSSEIDVMVDAIFDHRASNLHEPRTIYGKILAEADRLLDVQKVIDRTVFFEIHKHPELPLQAQLKHAFDHIMEKYGQQGYLKRYLDYEPNRLGEEALNRLIKDPKRLYQKLENAFTKNK